LPGTVQQILQTFLRATEKKKIKIGLELAGLACRRNAVRAKERLGDYFFWICCDDEVGKRKDEREIFYI
jgi:hypothetical protein